LFFRIKDYYNIKLVCVQEQVALFDGKTANIFARFPLFSPEKAPQPNNPVRNSAPERTLPAPPPRTRLSPSHARVRIARTL